MTVAVLALALVAGCREQPATNYERADGTSWPGRGSAGLSAAGELSPAEEEFLLTAEEELISRCMASKGFRYLVVPHKKDDPIRTYPYGDDDVASARRRGYGLREIERLVASRPENPQDRYARSLPRDQQYPYTRALVGDERSRITVTTPDGHTLSTPGVGCVADIRRAFYGDLREMLRLEHLARGVGHEAYRRVLADPRYVRALGKWRDCMRRRGYQFEDPGAARDAAFLATSGGTGLASLEREKRIAVDDATCSRQTSLAAVGERLDQQYRQSVADERQGEILAYREQRAAALLRAKHQFGVG